MKCARGNLLVVASNQLLPVNCRRRMDRPPSFPHYQIPNPNLFHQHPPLNSNLNFFLRPPPPLQTPNTYSVPPSPPRIRDLSGTLSSLQSLLSECQRTLDSLSQNLSLDHSSSPQGRFRSLPF
ncbi:hypothetical protein F2Q69_00002968 [Brassica cretica]|uniref:Uncharacterized protein n=1 Tax=Brassica cretica TaxID=69181 RepID=A0A8S9P2S7_BRACR|nr:hypothetical protein F2Q69_00002968 [Brassica cretica]